MLIEPTDVASYSVYDRVKNRPEELLAQDIIEAEAEAALITGHRFEDSLYDPLPGKVKLALVKLAQYFALVNSDESASSSYQSEKMGIIPTRFPEKAAFSGQRYIICSRSLSRRATPLNPPD